MVGRACRPAIGGTPRAGGGCPATGVAGAARPPLGTGPAPPRPGGRAGAGCPVAASAVAGTSNGSGWNRSSRAWRIEPGSDPVGVHVPAICGSSLSGGADRGCRAERPALADGRATPGATPSTGRHAGGRGVGQHRAAATSHSLGLRPLPVRAVQLAQRSLGRPEHLVQDRALPTPASPLTRIRSHPVIAFRSRGRSSVHSGVRSRPVVPECGPIGGPCRFRLVGDDHRDRPTEPACSIVRQLTSPANSAESMSSVPRLWRPGLDLVPQGAVVDAQLRPGRVGDDGVVVDRDHRVPPATALAEEMVQKLALPERAIAVQLFGDLPVSFFRVAPMSGLASSTRLVTLSVPATRRVMGCRIGAPAHVNGCRPR